MFRVFQALFGRGDQRGTPYPESLVQAAIERAVDGTDPRVRIVPGYARLLRPAVLQAIDHVVALVDSLPAPVRATPAGRTANPDLAAFFVSATRMAELLQRDNTLHDFREQHPGATANGLLLAQCQFKRGFGYGLVNDQLVSDVAQTTVSVDEHRLIELADNEADARRWLKRRAFDLLLSLALARVTGFQQERADLQQQRSLFRSKLEILQRAGGGFAQEARTSEYADIESRLAGLDEQLAALGRDDQVLQGNLQRVAEVLAEAAQHVCLESRSLCIDAHHVLQEEPSESAPAVNLVFLRVSDGREAIIRLVSIPPG